MEGILHNDIRLDRKKIGFNSNLKSISNFNQNDLYHYLNESNEIKSIVNLKEIKKIKFNKEISNSTSKLLFSFINLKIFFDIN